MFALNKQSKKSKARCGVLKTARDFSEGLAAVGKGGKSYSIDKEGNWIK